MTEEIINYSPIFIYGKKGLNKKKIFNSLANNHKSLFIEARQFLKELVKSVLDNTLEGFQDKYGNNDLLVINNIHLFANKPRSQEKFLILIKKIQLENKKVILFSNIKPDLIKNFNQDLRDSCYGGLMLNFEELKKLI